MIRRTIRAVGVTLAALLVLLGVNNVHAAGAFRAAATSIDWNEVDDSANNGVKGLAKLNDQVKALWAGTGNDKYESDCSITTKNSYFTSLAKTKTGIGGKVECETYNGFAMGKKSPDYDPPAANRSIILVLTSTTQAAAGVSGTLTVTVNVMPENEGPVPTPLYALNPKVIEISAAGGGMHDVPLTVYELFKDPESDPMEFGEPVNVTSGDGTAVFTIDTGPGNTGTLKITTTKAGVFNVSVGFSAKEKKLVDPEKSTKNSSARFKVLTGPNQAPYYPYGIEETTLLTPIAENSTAVPGDWALLVATDNAHDTVTYKVKETTVRGGKLSVTTASPGNGVAPTLKIDKAFDFESTGDSKFTVVATDEWGAETEITYTFTLTDVDELHKFMQEPESPLTITAQEVGETPVKTVTLSVVDPEGKVPTYAMIGGSTNPRVATAELVGNQLTITTLKHGETNIFLSAKIGADTVIEDYAVIVDLKTVGENEGPKFPDEIYALAYTVDEDIKPGMAETAANEFGACTKASDPNSGDVLTYTLEGTGAGTTFAIGKETACGYLKGKVDYEGEQRIYEGLTIVVTDTFGESDSIPLTILVVDKNDAPNLVGDAMGVLPVAPKVVKYGTTTVDVSDHFDDQDGDFLTYKVTTAQTGTLATVSNNGGSVISIKGVEAGTGVKVTVEASDPDGLKVSGTFTFNVDAPSGIEVVAANVPAHQPLNPGESSGLLSIAGVFVDKDQGEGAAPSVEIATDNEDVALFFRIGDDQLLVVARRTVGMATITLTGTSMVTGDVKTASFEVHVNSVPTLTVGTNSVTVNETETRDVTITVGDADGTQTLTVVAVSDAPDVATAEANAANDTLTITGGGHGTATITVHADDGPLMGQSEEYKIVVTVNSVPTSTAVAAQMLTVGGDAGTVDLTTVFSDADGDPLTYANTDSNAAVASSAIDANGMLTITGNSSGTATVTVMATDNDGASASATVSVAVNSAPTATTIPMQTIGVGQSLEIALTDVFTDSDGTISVNTVTSSNAAAVVAALVDSGGAVLLSGRALGMSSVSISASDDLGVTVTAAFDVKVNAAPAGAAIANQVVNVGASVTVDISGTFTDGNGDDLTVTTAHDSLVTVAMAGGELTITGLASGNSTVTVTATDTSNASVSVSFTTRVNAAPTVAEGVTPQTIVEGQIVRIDTSGVFADSDGTIASVTAVSSDDDVALIVPGADNIRIVGGDVGTATVTLTATDNDGAWTATSFDVTVNSANSAPSVAQSVGPINSTRIADPIEINLGDVFTDPDGDLLTITAVLADGTIADINISADFTTMTISGLTVGNTNVTLTAIDPDGLEVMDEFVITIENLAPELIAAIDDQSTTRGDDAIVLDISGTFADADDAGNLTFTVTAADGSIADAALDADAMTLTITGLAPGTTDFTVRVTDPFGAFAEDSFSLSVDTRPAASGSINPIALEVGGESGSSSFAGVFTDDDGDTLTYALSVGSSGVANTSLSGMSVSASPTTKGSTTFTVTATDPRGYTATATGNITVGDGELRKVAEQALAGYGRSVLSSVSGAVGSRLIADRQNSDLTAVASTSWNADNDQEALEALNMFSTDAGSTSNILDLGNNSVAMPTGLTSRNMKQSFSMNLGAAEGMNAWSIWGNADRQAFKGSSYDGLASNVYLGVDVQSNECWLFGLAMASNSGEADYTYGSATQTMDTSLTTFLPYFRYEPDARSTIWGVAGMGTGELGTTVTGSSKEASDLSLSLYMVGGRREITKMGRLDLALSGDAAVANLETKSGTGSADGLSAGINRFRAGLEGSFTTDTGNGGTLTPFAEVSLRQDGGDGDDTGTGVEFSGGVRINSAAFTLEARGRVLAMHSADEYSENGFSLTATLNPSSNGSGLNVSLAPRWGGSALDTSTMWQDDSVFNARSSHLALGQEIGSAIQAQIGYGMFVANDQFMVTPFVDLDVSDSDRSQLLVGARLEQLIKAPSNLGLEFSVGRVERRSTGEAGAQVGLNATLRF